MRTIFLLLFIMFSALLPLSVSADDIYVVTSSSKLNVRSQPSRSGTVIAQLRPGQEVRCIGTNGTWKHLRLDNGRQGYASAQFLSYRRPVNRQVNNPAPQSERSGSWWTSPTGMIIILIIVSFCLCKLLEFLDVEGWFGGLLIAISIGSYLGGMAGLLSWWIFDNFWTPYLVVVGIWIIFWLYKIISVHFEEKPYTGCDVIDWSDYSSGGSSSSSSSSYNSSSLSDDDDSDWERQQEEEEERQREERSRSCLRSASDYYSQYEYYKRLAEEAESKAETEERYADDYAYRAREFNDSSYARLASESRSNASRYRSKAQQYSSEAERYYNLYSEYQDRARW